MALFSPGRSKNNQLVSTGAGIGEQVFTELGIQRIPSNLNRNLNEVATGFVSQAYAGLSLPAEVL